MKFVLFYWVLFLVSVSSASARVHGLAGGCPQGSSYSDGCAGAPASGNFRVGNFFDYARQSGQTYVTRPPWNVAGVDYAIGIPASSFPLKNAKIDALPSGCVYSAVNAWVRCDAGASTVTFDGWDFNVGGCTRLLIGTGSGLVTVKNSNFKMGSGLCNDGTGLITAQTAVTSGLLLQSSVVDADAANFAATASWAANINWAANGSSSVTIEYTVLLHSRQHLVVMGDSGDLTIRYSYGEGMVYNGTNNHANWVFPGNLTNYTFSYNVGLEPSDVTAGTGGGAVTNFPTSNANTVSGTMLVNHNTLIANLAAGNATVAELIGVGAGGSIGTLTIQSNYFDYSGTTVNTCFANFGIPSTIGTMNWITNFNLVTGATSSIGCP